MSICLQWPCNLNVYCKYGWQENCRCVTVNTAMSLTENYKTTGECASDIGGTPRVSLYCPPGHMIHVRRSFHGARVTTGADRCDGQPGASPNCTYCPGDCIDETAGVVYDWTSCTGREACSRTVLQSLMPHCGPQTGGDTSAKTQSPAETSSDLKTDDIAAHSATWEHFSDYINVDYDCINRTNDAILRSHFLLWIIYLSSIIFCRFWRSLNIRDIAWLVVNIYKLWRGLFGSGTDPIYTSLFIRNTDIYIATHLVVVLLIVGATLLKEPMLRRFKSDRDEIWQDSSSRKIILTDSRPESNFLIWRHTFKMAVRPPIAAAYAGAIAGCPLAHRSRLSTLACCMRYSSWSVLHTCSDNISYGLNEKRWLT